MATRNHSHILVPARDWVQGPQRPKSKEAHAPRVRRPRMLPLCPRTRSLGSGRRADPPRRAKAASVTETGLAGSFSIPGKSPTVDALSINVRRRLLSMESETACGMTGPCLPLTSGLCQPGEQGALHPEGGFLSLRVPDAGSVPLGWNCRGTRLTRSWAAPGPKSLTCGVSYSAFVFSAECGTPYHCCYFVFWLTTWRMGWFPD